MPAPYVPHEPPMTRQYTHKSSAIGVRHGNAVQMRRFHAANPLMQQNPAQGTLPSGSARTPVTMAARVVVIPLVSSPPSASRAFGYRRAFRLHQCRLKRGWPYIVVH